LSLYLLLKSDAIILHDEVVELAALRVVPGRDHDARNVASKGLVSFLLVLLFRLPILLGLDYCSLVLLVCCCVLLLLRVLNVVVYLRLRLLLTFHRFKRHGSILRRGHALLKRAHIFLRAVTLQVTRALLLRLAVSWVVN